MERSKKKWMVFLVILVVVLSVLGTWTFLSTTHKVKVNNEPIAGAEIKLTILDSKESPSGLATAEVDE
ncbi:MAG: hypothetical protein V1725_01980 [archaeon]